MKKRGGGNTLGAMKAKLTRHANEYIQEIQEEQKEKIIKEIKKNKLRWGEIIHKLELADQDFDNWYDSPVIPERIFWTGEEFEFCLKILKNRLKQIRQENKKS